MTSWESVIRWWWTWVTQASWQLALLACLVGIMVWIVPRMPARLRHGLWLLVLIKVFLPPQLSLPIGIGQWGVRPIWSSVEREFDHFVEEQSQRSEADEVPYEASSESTTLAPTLSEASINRWQSWCWRIWCFGCATYVLWVATNLFKVRRWIRTAERIDEGPVRINLERIALRLRLKRVPEILATEAIVSPCLVGAFPAYIVLPRQLMNSLSEQDLTAVLTHELIHWRHGDTLIGWIQIVARGLLWFHPAIWWTNAELCHERECVCDETALRLCNLEPVQYGQSLLNVLTATRAKSQRGLSLAGVFEQSSRLQHRLEEIMSYEPNRRRFAGPVYAALMVAACVLIPMSPGPFESRENSMAAEDKPTNKSPTPVLVSTDPKIGATDVPTSLKEIKVTFDRKMAKGMSWTGGPPLFPTTDDSRKARWINDKTCVLPVKLEQGAFYRLGLNSKSFQNFRATDGTPLLPETLYFVTKDATQDVLDRVRMPKIAKLAPENGADNVDPDLESISVTFDVPMGAGMSWVKTPLTYPSAKDQVATWSEDQLTCTLPIKLVPGHEYGLSFNTKEHNNFQSEWGIPLTPLVYSFKTRPK